MSQSKAIKAIDRDGILLVFPIDNRRDPHSLWYELHPKTKMRWEWDEDGDSRVANLWHLRTELSTTRKVVYSKWFRGRATYFSRDLFRACLRLEQEHLLNLSRESREVLDTLISDSPLSTRQLKEIVGLQGRLLEPLFNKSLKPLWDHFQIVGFGEFEDSSFPSLGIGATRTLYEDLREESQTLDLRKAQATLDRFMPAGSLWRKYWDRTRTKAKAATLESGHE
ncbi:MAG: hypothetical protein ACK5Y2_09540 [Bdellovibrionales bacterium]